jgi:hypothetical protein
MSIAIRLTRVVVIEIAEFLGGSPIAHEGSAVTSHGHGEGKDVRVTLRIDRARPDIWRGLQDSVYYDDAVLLLRIEEYAVNEPTLDEVQRPFILMSMLPEAHLLPFPTPLLQPVRVEEVRLDSLQ